MMWMGLLKVAGAVTRSFPLKMVLLRMTRTWIGQSLCGNTEANALSDEDMKGIPLCRTVHYLKQQ